MLRKPSKLWRFLAPVYVAGAVVVTLTAVLSRPISRAEFEPALIALVAVAVLGETRTVYITRGEERPDQVTVSSTFSMALVLIAPLWLAMATACGAVAAIDISKRKAPVRVLFNVAQYALTVFLARSAYLVFSGHPLWATRQTFRAGDLGAALLSGGVFFLINNGLTGTAVALSTGRPVVRHVLADMRRQLAVSGVLLSFAPVVVTCLDLSTWLLPLVLLPIAAVHTSASLAARREQESLHDSLTGLPNRQMLNERLGRLLGEHDRDGEILAVLLADLDHFKEINDTLGHAVGDLLLRDVAQRMRETLRDTDTVARLGGDEFAVIATSVASTAEAQALAGRLVDALDQPFSIGGARLDIGASIGIACFPEHGTDASSLLQKADVALYVAKQHRGGHALYSAADDSHTPEKLSLLSDLRDALRNHELVVFYQPKADAQTGAVLGLEALVRWQHPTRGLIVPDDFIPLAENSGLIDDLFREVLDASLRQLRDWHRCGLDLSVAVNLSARQLTDLELPTRVGAALHRWDVPATALILEITETTIMLDPSRTGAVLTGLAALGVSIAIDDFGTGYSSLTHLRRLNAHELKIDRSFIMNMATDSGDAVIVRSTIELGHMLGLRTVAEGVEDGTTWSLLNHLGCDIVQGYYLSRPLPADEMSAWLTAHSTASLTSAAEAGRPDSLVG